MHMHMHMYSIHIIACIRICIYACMHAASAAAPVDRVQTISGPGNAELARAGFESLKHRGVWGGLACKELQLHHGLDVEDVQASIEDHTVVGACRRGVGVHKGRVERNELGNGRGEADVR